MGFASGSEVMDTVIAAIQEHVDDDNIRVKMYEQIAEAFWGVMDCDTLDECMGVDPAYDKALENIGFLEKEEDEEFEEDFDYDYD